jgi:inner membrane organizing system protein 1
MAAGLTVGAVLSLVLFKRKSWPIVFGLGSGFGMAVTNCQSELNSIGRASSS